MGEILRAVERTGVEDDTLIMFTSDHGPWYQGSPGLLRGRKASTFEGGFRVPLIARWPGMVEADTVVDVPCRNMDVLPSMVTLCGLRHPEKPLDGTDISKLLFSDDRAIEEKPQIYFSPMSQHGYAVHCIRKGDWKLRVAQGFGGEIYVNDRQASAHERQMAAHAGALQPGNGSGGEL